MEVGSNFSKNVYPSKTGFLGSKMYRDDIFDKYINLPIVSMLFSSRTCQLRRSTVILDARNVRSAWREKRLCNAVTRDGTLVRKKFREGRGEFDPTGIKGELLQEPETWRYPELSRTRDRATNPEICGSRNGVPATY